MFCVIVWLKPPIVFMRNLCSQYKEALQNVKKNAQWCGPLWWHPIPHMKFGAMLWMLKDWCFVLFFVLFLMEVRYNQTELSSVKKNNLSSSHSCCGHGTSLNTFVFAYPSAGVQEKHVFLPRLNCSAHWEWSAWIQQGFLFQSFHFGKLLWVLNFTKRTNCPSLLLSISFSFIGCPLSSCHLILLPAWIFLTTQYTVARGMPVHFFFFFLHFQFLHWFFQK